MLYLIATPIGNLEDFSFRAVRTIREMDYLLCEDTRRSRILLNHYDLSASLKSFQAYKEMGKIAAVLRDLQRGMHIGLLSDAGMPCISDPGARLVRACREADLSVTVIPGACSAVVALTGSGEDSSRFQFLGFLPRKKGKLLSVVQEIIQFPGSSICYESPHRLVRTLETLAETTPSLCCSVAREMTKTFEEYRKGTVEELCAFFQERPPRGELTLVFAQSAI